MLILCGICVWEVLRYQFDEAEASSESVAADKLVSPTLGIRQYTGLCRISERYPNDGLSGFA